MTTTPVLALPELASGQAVPETTVNEIARILEQMSNYAVVKDKDLTSPPGSPADGDAYIVAPSATGAWSGKDGKIAYRMSTSWEFIPVREGSAAYAQDENARYLYNGSAWALDGTGGAGGDLVSTNNLSDVADAATAGANIRPVESLLIACSDESTAITTGTAKVTFRMPYAFTLTDVRVSVNTAPTGSAILIDINEGGTTILSTKLMIDTSEKTSTTAATPAVISDASLADDAEITIDFDQVGSTIAGKGVKVVLIGHRT